MFDPKEFTRQVAKYSDVQLAHVLASAQEYTPEALKIVIEEWDRRKLTADAVAPAVGEAEKRAQQAALPDPTRPQAIKGIGLVCYGRDYSGSVGYITTQWFCVFAIPLFPTRSFYVDQPVFGAKGVASEMRAHRPQVVRTYLFLFLLMLIASGAIWLCSTFDDDHQYWTLAVAITTILVPMFFVEILRSRARRKRPIQSATAQCP